MLTCSKAFYELKNKLRTLYDDRECAAIAHEVLLFVTGMDKMQRLLHKDMLLTPGQQEMYHTAETHLLTGMPLQYVTHSAWFMGRDFYVDEHVLIPRPETEELVEWVMQDADATDKAILDIGTGSGCIPVTLKLALPASSITCCDISSGALDVAKRNAAKLKAGIDFVELDFLDVTQQNKLGTYNVIVSNPPYIPLDQKATLHTNVGDHEPSLALFVPAADALLFYRAIAIFGKTHLHAGGCIYCEIEANHSTECRTLFEQHGYINVEVRKDMHGNWRMLKAQKTA